MIKLYNESKNNNLSKAKIEILYNEFINEITKLLCELYTDKRVSEAREFLESLKTN